MSDFVMTANRLRDGRIVWLTAAGDWAESLDDAGIVTGEEALEEAKAVAARAEAAREVVSAYEIPVNREGRRILPLSTRERIRAAGGPTITPPSDADLAPPRPVYRAA